MGWRTYEISKETNDLLHLLFQLILTQFLTTLQKMINIEVQDLGHGKEFLASLPVLAHTEVDESGAGFIKRLDELRVVVEALSTNESAETKHDRRKRERE